MDSGLVKFSEEANWWQGVSEHILNGTSAQLGYTVPFTLDVLKNTGEKTN